jgi:peptide-methionine (R)-S-oxide reductase
MMKTPVRAENTLQGTSPINTTMINTTRRQGLAALISLGFGATLLIPSKRTVAATFTLLKKTKTEWKALLPPLSYRVLFEEATERAGSSPLNDEKRQGTYICAACNLPIFKSEQKFDSGTGWPSFFDALPGTLGTKTDLKAILPRTEYHCARCSGHQGHVFNDGPKPTGLRYCNNGVALSFVPSDQALPALRT